MRLFKDYELLSVEKSQIIKTVISSGTSGHSVSRIFLDRITATSQTRVLTKIVSSFTGTKRLPMLIIDTKSVIKNHKLFSARGAGILGFSMLGYDVTYALNDDMQLNFDVMEKFCDKHKGENILIFGFTYMIWEYFYKNRIKKEFIFFLPILILTILFLFRITAFLPILDKVYPDSVITLLIFFIVYYLLKIDFNLYKSWIKKIIILGIIFFAVLSIIANAVHTPYFVDHTPLENNILSLLEELPKDSKFVIFGINSTTSYSNAYYSYAPIFLNLSTSGGWSYSEKDAEYVKKFKAINQLLNEKNCEAITENLNYVNTTHIITQNDNCNTLEFCNLKKLKQINDVCLFQT